MPQPPANATSARDLKAYNDEEDKGKYRPLDARAARRRSRKKGWNRCRCECHMINPEKSFKLEIWDTIVFAALLETAIHIPYELAFQGVHLDAFFWTNRVVDIIFLVDLVLNFVTGYVDDLSGHVKTDFGHIARRYLSKWFLIDVISLVPVMMIDAICLRRNLRSSSDPEGAGHFESLRVLRLLRVLRFLAFTHGQRFFTRFQMSMGMPYTYVTIVQNIVLIAMSCHWSACLWGWVAIRERKDDVEVTWLTAAAAAKGASEKQFVDAYQIYVIAVYWGMMTLTGVGYGDITPQNHFEFQISIAVMAGLAMTWAFVIGNICTVLGTLSPREVHYKQSMDDLNVLLYDWNVPPDLGVKLRSYFQQGKQLNRYLEQTSLLERVSPDLHAQISIGLHRSWLEKVRYLRDQPMVELIPLLRHLRAIMYAPNETIPAHRTIYIVWRGICFRAGHMFFRYDVWGEDMVVDNEVLRNSQTAKSLGYTELLMLHFQDLEELTTRSLPIARAVRKAKKYVALMRGMCINHRVTLQLRLGKIIPNIRLDRDRRLKLACEVMKGKITERVLEEPVELEHAKEVLFGAIHHVEFRENTSDSSTCKTIAAGPVNPTKDRDGVTKSTAGYVFEAADSIDVQSVGASPHSDKHLKAIVGVVLEEFLNRSKLESRKLFTSEAEFEGKDAAWRKGGWGHSMSTYRNHQAHAHTRSWFRKSFTVANLHRHNSV